MQGISAKIIIDSVSPDAARLTSIEAEIPSNVHARVLNFPELTVSSAPAFGRVRALITATEWDDVCQRLESSGDLYAVFARMVQRELFYGVPAKRCANSWHLPYVDRNTIENACVYALDDVPTLGLSVGQLDSAVTRLCQMVSVARCARVGDGWLTLEGELAAYERLIRQWEGKEIPPAFKHAARADQVVSSGDDLIWAGALFHGNFIGWQQYGRGLIRQRESLTHDESKVIYLFNHGDQHNGDRHANPRGPA